MVCCSFQNRRPYREGDAMFAGGLVLSISRTLTANRLPVCDCDDVLVIRGIGVTAVPHLYTITDDGEFKRFVLGALCDAGRKVENSQWMHSRSSAIGTALTHRARKKRLPQ